MRARWLLCLCVLVLLPLSGASAQSGVLTWSAPAGFYHDTEVIFPTTNADATQVVFLNPYSTTPGATEWYYDRQVLFMEYTGGAWSSKVVVGNNGMYRPDGWLPVVTHPVISGDGSTIAYLGCTGSCKPFSQGDVYDIYVSRRGPVGWSQPAVVATGGVSLGSQISLSFDGKTLAYVTSYFFADNFWDRVYVVTRTNETWSSPTPVSADGINAFLPVLSRDGTQLFWRSNPEGGGSDVLKYASLLAGGGWSAPQVLVSNPLGSGSADFYTFSPDGNSIFYWNTNTSGDPDDVYLYVLHRTGSTWSSPQQVTPGVYAYTNEGLTAGINFDGTRVIYPHPRLDQSVVNEVSLDMIEYKGGAWGAPSPVTVDKPGAVNMNQSPELSDDGNRLLALGPSAAYEGSGLVLFTSTVKYFSYLPFTKK